MNMESLKKIRKLKAALKLVLISVAATLLTMTASAAAPAAPAGGDMWSEISGFIETWIPRLGGAIIVIGLVMFGIGWQRDDAEGRTRGIQVAIGGAIVAAVGALVPTFMA
jgi:hypothetical protein